MTRPPLIILGAGASFDLAPSPVRSAPGLPLTDTLLSVDRLDRNLLQDFPEVADLFSMIAPRVAHEDPGKRQSLEAGVASVADQTQLVALRFYLASYFEKASASTRIAEQKVNNYRALIQHIGRSPAKGACIVSFNYDTLFERQLETIGLSFIDMVDYINHPIKFIKAHGSCDWYHLAHRMRYSGPAAPQNAYEYLKLDTAFLSQAFDDRQFYTGTHLNNVNGLEDHFRIPVIAMPNSGDKPFVCPPSHYHMLESVLPNIDRILIIGWRAGDTHLLNLMKEHIQSSTSVYIVTGPQDADQVKKNLGAVPQLVIAGEEVGFSGFLASTLCDTFFSNRKG